MRPAWALLFFCLSVSAQAVDRPDLSGTWDVGSLTPLERPEAYADQAYFSKAQARAYVRDFDPLTKGVPPWMDHGTGLEPDLRTSLITYPENGKIPYSESFRIRQQVREQKRKTYSDPEVLDLGERCIEDVVPMFPGPENNYISIVQTDDYVLVVREFMNSTRLIRLTSPRRDLPIQSWTGISHGRWKDGRLVVETENFRPNSSLFGAGETARLTESFEMLSEDTIRYEFTIQDDSAFTLEWTAGFHFKRTSLKRYEFACHEGNFGTMRSILRGARLQED